MGVDLNKICKIRVQEQEEMSHASDKQERTQPRWPGREREVERRENKYKDETR
jgi:hypothetical protein